jgi:hypothetical protein
MGKIVRVAVRVAHARGLYEDGDALSEREPVGHDEDFQEEDHADEEEFGDPG